MNAYQFSRAPTCELCTPLLGELYHDRLPAAGSSQRDPIVVHIGLLEQNISTAVSIQNLSARHAIANRPGVHASVVCTPNGL